MSSATFGHERLGVYSEGSPPTDVADRLMASIPQYMGVGLAQRAAKTISGLDKCVCVSALIGLGEADQAWWCICKKKRDILDGLRNCGFKLNFGIHDSGFGLLGSKRVGGFYIGYVLFCCLASPILTHTYVF